MKYLIIIGLFLSACIGAYYLGKYQNTQIIESAIAPETVTIFIHDTVIQKEVVEVPVYKEIIKSVIPDGNNETDTINELVVAEIEDSLLSVEISEEEITIVRDEFVEAKTIQIIQLEKVRQKDSLIKGMLGIKSIESNEMVLQFWESPLNFTGYKLAKNTLILYGVSPQFEYNVYQKGEKRYLESNSTYYNLVETQEFLPLNEVEEKQILND